MFKKWSKILKKNCIGSKKYKKIKNVSIPVDKKLIENCTNFSAIFFTTIEKNKYVARIKSHRGDNLKRRRTKFWLKNL